MHPWANRPQQSSLPNYQETKRPGNSAPLRACAGEGALAPSCRALHGHDQTSVDLACFPFFRKKYLDLEKGGYECGIEQNRTQR